MMKFQGRDNMKAKEENLVSQLAKDAVNEGNGQ